MEIRKTVVEGIQIRYPVSETDCGRLVTTACARTVQVLREHWHVAVPSDCRVYVMTSWQKFLFDSAPWYWKPYLVTAYPFVALRAAHIWRFAGGWAIRYGKRVVVGVKPYRLMVEADQTPGRQIYIAGRTPEEKVETVTCHELTHAFTFHLGLPGWLFEGLATRAMEHYLESPVIKAGTLDVLTDGISTMDDNLQPRMRALVTEYLRGYWLTRYIEATQPRLLQQFLTARLDRKEFERQLTAALGRSVKDYRRDKFPEVREYFIKVILCG